MLISLSKNFERMRETFLLYILKKQSNNQKSRQSKQIATLIQKIRKLQYIWTMHSQK